MRTFWGVFKGQIGEHLKDILGSDYFKDINYCIDL